MFLSLFIVFVCGVGGWVGRQGTGVGQGTFDIFFTPVTFRRYQFSLRQYQFFWQFETLMTIER